MKLFTTIAVDGMVWTRSCAADNSEKYFSCDILILVGDNSEYVSHSVKLNQVLSTKASDKVFFTTIDLELWNIFL